MDISEIIALERVLVDKAILHDQIDVVLKVGKDGDIVQRITFD